MNEYEFFYCYSYNVSQFLKNKGIRYVVTAKNLNSDKQFWMYVQNNELTNALNEYK